LFERLLALRNDLGLLSEEYDPIAGRQVGNFPQAFSHVSLVNTAVGLSQELAGTGITHADRLNQIPMPPRRERKRRHGHARHLIGFGH
jgi:Glycosyl hydrolases family 15